jgi:hypothetical protein
MIATVAPPESAQLAPSRWSQFRLIPRIDTWPFIVAFVQTPPGKLALLACFGLGLETVVHNLALCLALLAAYAVITFEPKLRHPVIAVAPLILGLLQNLRHPLELGETFAVLALGMGLWFCVLRWPRTLFARRPIVFLLSGFSALIVVAGSVPPQSRLAAVLWSLVGASAASVWFIAYALTDKGSRPGRDGALELAALRPLWGSTTTPFPKGAAYLRRIEAKTPEELAVVQLKGLKLLAWAILLGLFQRFWFWFFHGYLGIPLPDKAMEMFLQGAPIAWYMRWTTQILFLFEVVLGISVFGHTFVAGARMAGFRALRNTWRPFSATTVIDFFNRFYYYFKELLVDLFYFPAFLRYFKKHRRVRTIFATFSAVLFGDCFFHITRDWHFLRERGLWRGMLSYQEGFFCCLILAIALSVSQLRKRRPRPRGFLRGQLLPSLKVGFFYTLMAVFGSDSHAFTIAQSLRYFASLFFIHIRI